ncbi:cellulose synthase/poly-beta-1,6-N-acetylglucosamine synthase-like glycosyltransferase/peptidoglycan/xylan/chitin deacetylase (PgdA/CDA1 family) [Saccharothrix ecbatanensis]|uniref:Cellulose synthase/poly-beta-1,6-N-acetylglucosamine synthase-like glycosyltransferase/peptidoglycan/xylan/chitin deacetylase (PgdA/CDA1 family) n=1 Tax=Saccharothrix ecbatanensis TaxID=1105145 RepID=A0A7W9HPD4_9PSEU|nr:bifunctional polysaccharide deacetylase/glycosyltransferase family 2 protein [Saccharothrix ecbatanensis]MBB5806012.1 cellulose synthase/poly-beta-1,6-N-acetylglucosamine synthase-like glycosyltransferase/peptidoglycan/xylan/chitin deacetylase (PgdA/CDA1 family) [Saccharothrix ecbatanensis]
MRAHLPSPRTHWLLLALSLVALLGFLLLDVLVVQKVGQGEAPSAGPADLVPESVRAGGPLIGSDGNGLTSRAVPDGAVVLTFDDGPDPVWTPQVLEVLRRNGVKATFFVTGVAAAQYPDLVEQMADEGHEVGLHTFTHVDLGKIGEARTAMELGQTQLVVAAATGRASTLVRPPYSSSPEALDNEDLASVERMVASGHLVLLSTHDTEDWRNPGVDAIVAAAVPADKRGAVVLAHDGGGDRSQTVAALETLIPKLREQGRQFRTASDALGVPIARSASVVEQTKGTAVSLAVRAAAATTDLMLWLVVVSSVLAMLRAVLLLTTTGIHARRARKVGKHVRRLRRQPVTVLVPAYNEEAGIEATLRTILASTAEVRVIVVDDGSTDRTSEVVRSLDLPGVTLIRQANAGKAAALNTGLKHCRTELVVMVDGDTVLEPDTVAELVEPFADPDVGAVSGNAKVGNRDGLLGRWQHIEYVIGFNLDRRMYDVMECMPTVPGAVGGFRLSALQQVGGVPEDTLAEDTDLTMALERAGWAVTYRETARAWTEAPATLGQLWRQRYRWCYGTLQAMWKHRGAVFERGLGGRLGRRGLPYLALYQVVLPVLAPVIDVFAVLSLFTDPLRGAAAWLGFLVLQLVPAVIAFRLDRESLRPLWAVALQPVVYRQLMYLVVIQSLITAIAGARLPWQKLKRTGTAAQHAPELATEAEVTAPLGSVRAVEDEVTKPLRVG